MNTLEQIRTALAQVTLSDVLGAVAIFATLFILLWVTP